jgi:tetratricopeptide (TPR) repeat protein
MLKRSERLAFNDLGIYDDNYLTILNDLGLALSKSGDYDAAEKLLKQCLTLRVEVLQPGGEQGLLNTMGNLALVYEAQARFAEAKKYTKGCSLWLHRPRKTPIGPLWDTL